MSTNLIRIIESMLKSFYVYKLLHLQALHNYKPGIDFCRIIAQFVCFTSSSESPVTIYIIIYCHELTDLYLTLKKLHVIKALPIYTFFCLFMTSSYTSYR